MFKRAAAGGGWLPCVWVERNNFIIDSFRTQPPICWRVLSSIPSRDRVIRSSIAARRLPGQRQVACGAFLVTFSSGYPSGYPASSPASHLVIPGYPASSPASHLVIPGYPAAAWPAARRGPGASHPAAATLLMLRPPSQRLAMAGAAAAEWPGLSASCWHTFEAAW